jgi:hypothetical protein
MIGMEHNPSYLPDDAGVMDVMSQVDTAFCHSLHVQMFQLDMLMVLLQYGVD